MNVRSVDPKRWRDWRDLLLFAGGAAGVFHETFIPDSPSERPALLLLFAAMMGVAAYGRKDDE